MCIQHCGDNGKSDTKYSCISCSICICNICSVQGDEKYDEYSEEHYRVGFCKKCLKKENADIVETVATATVKIIRLKPVKGWG